MQVLIVGAGAVGQVYGRYAQLGGAKVTYFVREKYAADCRKDLVFYIMNKRNVRDRHVPVRMSGHEVMTRIEEVAKQQWDLVFLCMSSTGLRGDWLDPMLKAIGQATLIMLQPGMNDRDYLAGRFPVERLVEGTIPIVSYKAPLPGEQIPEPGIAYWIPAFQNVELTGSPSRVTPILELFKRGGFRALAHPNVLKAGIVPGTVLGVFINTLESAGWSFARVKNAATLALACRAMPEAIRVLCRKRDVPFPTAAPWILRPWFFRFLIWATHFVVPFDFETYLRVHFTKVGDQMHQGLEDLISNGKQLGVPVQSLIELQTAVTGRTI